MGLPDVGHYPELFVALLDSGTWSLEDLRKLAGLNFLRVLKDVEKVGLPLHNLVQTTFFNVKFPFSFSNVFYETITFIIVPRTNVILSFSLQNLDFS